MAHVLRWSHCIPVFPCRHDISKYGYVVVALCLGSSAISIILWFLTERNKGSQGSKTFNAQKERSSENVAVRMLGFSNHCCVLYGIGSDCPFISSFHAYAAWSPFFRILKTFAILLHCCSHSGATVKRGSNFDICSCKHIASNALARWKVLLYVHIVSGK